MLDLLEKAGFFSIAITIVTKVVKGDKSFPVLLATAQSR